VTTICNPLHNAHLSGAVGRPHPHLYASLATLPPMAKKVRGGGPGLEPEFSPVLKGRKGAALDQLDALILHNVAETGSLTEAAKKTGISYRNAWDRVDELQKRLGQKVVVATPGGAGGGGAELSPVGRRLYAEYRRLNNYLFAALGDRDFWQHVSYRLSARNRVRATIVEIEEGPITSAIRMRIGAPGKLTSIISNEAVGELELKVGDEVDAVVKATEVIIAKAQKRSLSHRKSRQ
jgi:molybdate transport system regulatory protein